MLETLRRNSRSAIIYVLFGILIAVFALSFGPQSRGLTVTGSSTSVAAKIADATVTEQDFRFAYNASGFSQAPPQIAKERRLKEIVMDKLIERELQAEEAKKLGFLVSQKEVEDQIMDGKMMTMGRPSRIDPYAFKDGKLDYDRFKMVAQNSLGVSVIRFIDIQRRELLAEKLRELLRGGVRVSPAEVKDEFIDHGLQVNLEFVKFSSRKFESDDEPSAADVAAYIKAHDADLRKIYDERKALLFTKVEKQARLRHILVEVAKDAPADAVAKAKARIDEAKKQIAATPFGTVAAQASTHELTKKKHGLIGWKKKGLTTLGDTLDGKIFAATAKKGDIIGPERTDRGFEIVLIEDFREGDVSFEQAAPEIAEQEMTRERAKDKAKAEAQAALDKAKAGEKLEVMFPAPKDDHSKDDDKSPQASLQRMINAQLDAPSLKETGLFSRTGDRVQQIGVSKELSSKAFSLKVGELAGPFDVGGAYVIVRVKEHKDADMKDYEKRHLELERDAARVKWYTTVESWSKDRCIEMRDAGRIKVTDEIMAYDGAGGGSGRVVLGGEKGGGPYVPCSPRSQF